MIKKKKKWVKTNFKETIEEHGYPVISKDVACKIATARRKPDSMRAKILRGEIENYKMFGGGGKYAYLVDAPFKISDNCCKIMKKNPLMIYERETGKHPIIGVMASESITRKAKWLKLGCNAFDAKHPVSQPMAFWTEQDVLQYIKQFNIPYCKKIYGEIIEEMTSYKRKENKPTGKLMCSGLNRTGCTFCMFGCHLEKEPNRFQRMKETHPKLYDYCIRNVEEKGLGLGNVLDYIDVKY